MFFNTTYRTSWNLKNKDHAEVIVESKESEIILYFGRTATDSLAMYAEELGPTLIPPKFAFGLWYYSFVINIIIFLVGKGVGE